MTTPILIGDNNEKLNEILKDQRFADKKVCVVSVAGAFRTGKSFILNFFLRYLRAQANGTENWMDMDKELTGNKDKPDTGFHWCRSAKSVTKGILIWLELFLLKDRNGEEVVVILMDTEGIFDTGSSDKKNVTTFALSTMISSVQVFNIQNKIQGDHLQHLQLFANYAQLALDEQGNSTKPFQSLLFLVRDWSDDDEYEYGINGGQRILDETLMVKPDQSMELQKLSPELQQLRRHIDSAFNDIRCFLMPHPGLQVANSAQFRGELDNINSEFKTELLSLVTHLFLPSNLVVKQINGQPITCSELADYINAYSEVFRGDKLPEPMTIFTATAEVTNSAAVDNAKAVYEQKMEKIFGEDKPFLSDAELRAGHERYRTEAMRVFQDAKKMGGPELTAKFAEKLEKDIQEAFKSFELINDIKKKEAEITNLAAVDNAKELYKREMEKNVCDGDKPFLSVAELYAGHERCRAKALRAFDANKLGGTELTKQFVEQLKHGIQEAFQTFELINDNKKQTADATNSAAVDSANAVYEREMKKVCGEDKPFLSIAELRAGHERCREKAFGVFGAKKMGGTELTAHFVEKLNMDIQKAFGSFERSNFKHTVKRAEEKADKEKERAEKAEWMAKQAEERANEERERADREKKRADSEKKRADEKCTLL